MSEQAYKLEDCQEMNRLHPDTFQIPPEEEIANLKPKDEVFLIFLGGEDQGERMWVTLDTIDPKTKTITGKLDNQPVILTDLKFGMKITCQFKHVADYMTQEEAKKEKEEFEKTGLIPGAFNKETAIKVIEKLITMSIYPGSLFALGQGDVDFYQKEKASTLKTIDNYKEDMQQSVLGLIKLARIFFHFVVENALNQIIEFEEPKDKTQLPDKQYLSDLLTILRGDIQDVYWQIADNYIFIFEEYNQKYGNKDSQKMETRQLPDHFSLLLIKEALEKVKELAAKQGVDIK